MARASRTDLAVLGALSTEPMTGYAVRAGIRDVLGHFWSESYGQIYPTLARLEADGFVQRADGERPRSSVYSLTAAGSARLLELLSAPDEPTPPRNGLLLRVFFGHVLGAEAVAGLVRANRERAMAQLEDLESARAGIDPRDEHAPFALLTVSAGERAARAAIDWADEALEVLAGLDPEGGAGAGAGVGGAGAGAGVDGAAAAGARSAGGAAAAADTGSEGGAAGGSSSEGGAAGGSSSEGGAADGPGATVRRQ